jgi:hypothetical protein
MHRWVPDPTPTPARHAPRVGGGSSAWSMPPAGFVSVGSRVSRPTLLRAYKLRLWIYSFCAWHHIGSAAFIVLGGVSDTQIPPGHGNPPASSLTHRRAANRT